jgi:hypothetical protein
MMSDQGLMWGAGSNDPCRLYQGGPWLDSLRNAVDPEGLQLSLTSPAIVCRANSLRAFHNVSLVSVLAGTSRPRGTPQTSGSRPAGISEDRYLG